MPRNIVIDLDECLVKMFADEWDLYERIMRSPSLLSLRGRTVVVRLDDGMYIWGIKRPHLREFIMFCFARFDTVSVWSAGTFDYVHLVTRQLFRDVHLPDIVLTRLNVENGERGSYWKPLDRFYRMVDDGSVGPSNTFLLDNRPENFVKNVGNGIHIPDYDPEPTVEELSRDDDSLLRLIQFCSEVGRGTDVRRINKVSVFDSAPPKSFDAIEHYSNFRDPVFL